jgi:hypothetical protein
MSEVYHVLLLSHYLYKLQHTRANVRATLGYVMALFLNQNEQRSQLQTKIAADLGERVKTQQIGGQEGLQPTMLEESQAATGRSLFWVGVVTMVVIALVLFVLFIFNGI